MIKQVKIDYKNLRKINPEAARTAVLEYLSSNGGNVLDCSKVFGINRTVIYDIIKKGKESNLKDRSKAPKNIPHKTPPNIERIVVEIAQTTKLSPKRLGYHLMKYNRLDIPYGTLRHILRRNKI